MVSTYTADSIKVLKGLDGVRKRPDMYIGDRDVSGFHHLVWEILDNSVDESLAGFCDEITISFSEDGSVAVTDNGRGIPVGINKTENMSGIDLAMTILHAGGKFGGEDSAFKTSGGLHGVGASVVNALSKWLKVTVRQDGFIWYREYQEGVPTKPEIEKIGSCSKKKKETGTSVQFLPDLKYFSCKKYDHAIVRERIEELAHLNPGLTLHLDWFGEKESFLSEDGLLTFLSRLVGKRERVCPDIVVSGEKDGSKIECAFAFTDDYESNIHSYANNICTHEGGVHLNSAIDSLTKAVTAAAKNFNLFKSLGDLKPSKSDVCEGLSMIVSVRVQEPAFGGQTKSRLTNDELRVPFGDWFLEQFQEYLAANKNIAKSIATKVVESMKSKDADKKAKNLSRKKSSVGNALLDKLTDCSSKDFKRNEVFLVEGDSAGGTAIQSRNRTNQAVLPLRGKILNVQKTSLNKALEDNSVATIFAVLGITPSERDANIEGLRYGKIIVTNDADVDGYHIRNLLLSLLFKYSRKLFDVGCVYICEPPLYRVRIGNTDEYIKDDAALVEFKKKNEGKKIEISRFKGLGEMSPQELAETAMEPATRRIRRVYFEDAKKIQELLDVALGEGSDNLKERKKFLVEKLGLGDGI